MSTLLDIAKHKGVTIQKIVTHIKESFGIDVPCSAKSFVPDNIAQVIVPTIFNRRKQYSSTQSNPQQRKNTSRTSSTKSKTFKSSSNIVRDSAEIRLINSDTTELVGTVINILPHSIFLRILDGGHIEAPLQNTQDYNKIEIGDIICLEPVEDEDLEKTNFLVVYAMPVASWQLMKLRTSLGRNTINGIVLYENHEKKYVAVNVFGYKALLYANQVPAGVNLHPGDTIEVVVDRVEGENAPSFVTLSMTKVADFKAYLEREAIRRLRKERQEAKNRDFNKIEIGDLVQCYVKEINDEKSFMLVSFGNLTGIIFKNEIFGTNIRRISHYFEEGDELAAVITDKRREDGKLKIKLRYQEFGSWDKLELEAGTEFEECSVIEISDEGVYLSLDDGLEGFLPMREMTRMEYNAIKIMSSDMTLGPVYIKKYDPRHKSLTLTRLPCYEEIWETVPSRYIPEQLYEAQVIDIEDNRLWVKFEDGVESCLDRSDLLWKNTGGEIMDFTVGQLLNVLVTRVDSEKQKIFASIRHLTPDPWEMADENLRGTSIEVVVIDYKEGKHVKVETTDSLRLQGIINLSEVSWQHTSQNLPLKQIPQIGDKLLAKVIVFDKMVRRMNLSIRQLEPDPWSGIEPGAVVRGSLKYDLAQSAMQVVLENGLMACIKEDFPQAMSGQPMEFKVVDCNRQTKSIQVSHSQLQYDQANDMIISNFFKSIKF